MGYTKSEGSFLFSKYHSRKCKNESGASCNEYTTVYRGKQKEPFGLNTEALCDLYGKVLNLYLSDKNAKDIRRVEK